MSTPLRRPKRARRFRPDRDVEEWHGRYVPYDIVEGAIRRASWRHVLLVLSGWRSFCRPPTSPPVTIKSWSRHTPLDFARTAVTELARHEPDRHLRAPVQRTPGREARRSARSRSRASWGCTTRSTPRSDDVLEPLRTLPTDPVADGRDQAVHAAPRKTQQARGRTPTGTALTDARFGDGRLRHPTGNYGPVAEHDRRVDDDGPERRPGRRAARARSSSTGRTTPSRCCSSRTARTCRTSRPCQHLQGNQWGMMNETGNYPGQAWLWLYTLLVSGPAVHDLDERRRPRLGDHGGAHRPPCPRAIPAGRARHPRKIRIYRLIWRQHYRSLAARVDDAV